MTAQRAPNDDRAVGSDRGTYVDAYEKWLRELDKRWAEREPPPRSTLIPCSS